MQRHGPDRAAVGLHFNAGEADILAAEGRAGRLEPGQHGCAEVTSRAVEMGLENSGLEESKWRPMLEAWLKDKGLTAYYVTKK